MGLGPFPDISLAEARERAQTYRRHKHDRIDPLEAKRERQRANVIEARRGVSFRDVAGQYIERQKAGWRNAKHAQQWSNTLETYVYPMIGDLPVVLIAQRLAALGWVLRSGGAVGADIAFEEGAKEKEIYRGSDATDEALRVAARLHPAWDRCSDHARRLLARNVFQVLGPDLCTPSDMVICWTLDGKDTGGTAIALRIAQEHAIPVFNLFDPKATMALEEALSAWQSTNASTCRMDGSPMQFGG
jgi:hypothetical protein